MKSSMHWLSFQRATLHLIRTGVHWAGFSVESARQRLKGQATPVGMADSLGKLPKEA